MKYKLFIICVAIAALALLPFKTVKAEEATDWVIREFRSEITVNKDSSLDILEKIIADCGTLPDKHGIFRVIPYLSRGVNKEKFKTPITLESITDGASKPIPYETVKNTQDSTISLKIGDPNKTVTGVNQYNIRYHVQNAIRQGDTTIDELYWNLNGNFWNLKTEKYSATIIFPGDLPLSSQTTSLYAGEYGKDISGLAKYAWDINILDVSSLRALEPGEGITVSVSMPKNYFIPYRPSFWEKYGLYFYALIPLLVLTLSYLLWRKYGRDPRMNWTKAPEFEIPEDLAPVEYGLVLSDGTMKNNYLTAAIVALAVKKQLKIYQTKEKTLLSEADYSIERLGSKGIKLSATEELLLEKLFDGRDSVDLSSLKNKFYKDIPLIEKSGLDFLEQNRWVERSSRGWMSVFLVAGFLVIIASFMLFASSTTLAICVLISGVILLFFALLMRHRTEEGALLLRRLKGFELYMRKAEKYRQQWLEKQNVFETFLPYAILYGIAGEWVKKMKSIYGEQYFAHYHPVWYLGYNGSFNIDGLSANIDNISHNIATTLSSTPSSSGSGGGGFSGGGGGGGGGGGW